MKTFIKTWALLACLVSFSTTLLAEVKTYSLSIKKQPVAIAGQKVERITINNTIPGQTLEFTEGDEAVIHVKNQMNEPTSLHWHGLLVPAMMDGVPGFNGYSEIQPNESFTYRFKIRQTGTYWYHSHSGTQEQDGQYAPFIIYPKQQDVKADKDYVVMISEFHPKNGGEILDGLKNAGHQMHNGMMDLSDVKGYTFLINGKSSDENWLALAKKGEKVRLRFINAGAASYFDVKIPGLKMQVVAADGQLVEPVEVDQFRFAPGETYDVIVSPKEDKAYAITATSIDNLGAAIGTLAPNMGMKADKVVMANEESSLQKQCTPDHCSHAMSQDSDQHGDKDSSKKMHHSGMNHAEMDHASMDHSNMNRADMNHGSTDHRTMVHGDMDHGTMDHSKMMSNMEGSDSMSSHRQTMADNWKSVNVKSGDKVLDYKDLKLLGEQTDLREPEREIKVTLEGGMKDYIWTMDGKTAADAKPIDLKYGERVRLTFVNNSMMAHPMHLHGMFMQLENGQDAHKLPNKHTVNIAPGETYSVLLSANEVGEWAFHCHLFYHMATGMMNKVVVAKLED